MSTLTFQPKLKPILAIAVTLILVASLVPFALGQGATNDPLRRQDGQSSINGIPVLDVLDADPPLWMGSLEPLGLNLRYQCGNFIAIPPCAIDTVATVHYTFDGSNPRTSQTAQTADIEGVSDGTVPGNPVRFNDELDVSGGNEGDTLRFIVEISLDNPPDGNCDGDDGDPCFDPIHTSGELFYEVRLDYSQPQFAVQQTDDNFLFLMDEEDNEWWMFTTEEMAGENLIPDIRIAVIDNTTGAPLDEDATVFDRDTGSSNFTRNPDEGGHAVLYTIVPDNGNSFSRDSTSTIDITFADRAGNQVTGELKVSMDHTDPTIDNGTSTLARVGSDDVPAALGDPLRVHINATDIAGSGEETPPELLNVEVRLFTENRATVGNWQSVSYNETEEHFFSTTDVRLPSDAWDSGLTFAEVRVTDVVGNVAGPVPINGTITVDADFPVIEPVAPLGDGDDLVFSADQDIEFIIRAFDPGNSDDWDGADTEDTDGLGIDFGTVQLHYRIGEDGSRTTVVLEPQTAENTFRVLRGFGELEEVYHYFSAEDHAGNRITYPGPGDPHHQIDAAGNDGRYLLLHTDRVGPDIEPSRDHTFLGGSGDHEYRFNITDDPGVGLDDETPQLFWREQGDSDYTAVDLSESQVEHDLTGDLFTTFTASIPRQAENTVVEYYVEAEDLLGNLGNLGTAAAPQITEIDLTPPTVTVNAPASSNENRFNITWQGQDDLSGVRDYTVQFRIADGTWRNAPGMERTTMTSWEVCAATGVVYEFRVSARDNAGNERTLPEVADASTQVTAPESCTEPPTISLTSPGDGDTLTGEVNVEWNAVSTVFPEDLTVRIEADGTLVAGDLAPSGEHLWDTSAVHPDEPCFSDGSYTLRVAALDIGNLEAAEEITVTLQNGITSQDCADRHPASTPFGDEPGEFNPLYLLVVVAFVGLAAVFAIGMARRW